MRHFLIVTCAILFLGCSSPATQKTGTSLEEKTLATTFTDEGIKITYSLLGKLEAIEVYGQAEAWRGNVEAFAEADAMAKLTKFAYGSNVDTQRRVNIIGKSISTAQDIVNSDKANSKPLSFTDKELETKSNETVNALRDAKAVNEATVSTITTITSKGRLLGVRKIRDYQRDDGKTYVAVYQWSEKDNAAADNVRKRMQRRDD
jgi:hypothetical protein